MVEQQASPQPYGTEQPRPRWPVYVLAVLYALWFIFMVILAVRYPAR